MKKVLVLTVILLVVCIVAMSAVLVIEHNNKIVYENKIEKLKNENEQLVYDSELYTRVNEKVREIMIDELAGYVTAEEYDKYTYDYAYFLFTGVGEIIEEEKEKLEAERKSENARRKHYELSI